MDVVQQRFILVGQFFLFQINQLSQCHLQNGIRLNRRQGINVGNPAHALKVRETFAKGAFQHCRRTLNLHKPGFRLRLSRGCPDNPDHFVDIGMSD